MTEEETAELEFLEKRITTELFGEIEIIEGKAYEYITFIIIETGEVKTIDKNEEEILTSLMNNPCVYYNSNIEKPPRYKMREVYIVNKETMSDFPEIFEERFPDFIKKKR